MSNFPIEAQLIAARFPSGKIVCLEGAYRATTVALAKAKERSIDFSSRTLTMALTEMRQGSEVFEEGSSHPKSA